MKIITLVENQVKLEGLQAEHGISILIDTGSEKILFDTGQSDLFIRNANEMGIDLAEIDFLVLSHGHYDHTGGLYSFLRLNTKAKIICKSNIFIPKYNSLGKFIGFHFIEDLLKGRLIFIHSITELVNNIFVFPQIHIYNEIDTHFTDLRIKVKDELMLDEMMDEIFIVLKHKNKFSILTACSHRGITNICKTAIDYFNMPVNAVIGGFHLKNSTVEQYKFIVEYLNVKVTPSLVGVCHCTGIEKFELMKTDLNSYVFYNDTGKILDL